MMSGGCVVRREASPLLQLIGVAVGMLGFPIASAHAELPRDFGPTLRRICSTKSWLLRRPYQWLPDGRLLIFKGTRPDEPELPCLFVPSTGKTLPLRFFTSVYRTGPLFIRGSMSPEQMTPRNSLLSPDGQSVLSLLGTFHGIPKGWRILSLDGCRMHVSPTVEPYTYFNISAVWEWREGYHGWAILVYALTPTRGMDLAVAHFDLSKPETPSIVFVNSVFPTWPSYNNTVVNVLAETPDGWGVIGPFLSPFYLAELAAWRDEHKIPITLVDFREGKRKPIDYKVAIPTGAVVKDYVVSPDTRRIAWQVRFPDPQRLPNSSKRYRTDELWVSRLDGTDMHRMGYQAADFSRANEGLIQLGWRDNETISFIHSDTLYTVSLPGGPAQQ
jgi:hypothetical protein